MRRAFLRQLRRSAKSRASSGVRVDRREIVRQTEKYLSENGHLAKSAAETSHLEIACLVLAAHHFLGQQAIDDDVIKEILEDAVLKPGRRITRWATRIMLALSRDPMATLVRFSSERIPPAYGSLFRFAEERSEPDSYTMRVTRCFYHEFFARYQVPHLTRIFCRWDEAWIKPISVVRHRVEFTRSETIATGGQSCPFTFRRSRNRAAD